METSFPEIVGFDAVVQHFGHWPSFHDAVMEGLAIDDKGNITLSLTTWNDTRDLDEHGYYKTTHRATVDFALSDVQSMELVGDDIWAGSITFGLSVARETNCYRIRIDPCLGVSGWIDCKTIRLSLRANSDA